MRKLLAILIVFSLVIAALCAVPVCAKSDASGSNVIYYWSFDGDCKELSHKDFEQDYNEMIPDFGEGILGEAVDLTGCPIQTDFFPDDVPMDAFTLSYWFKWSGDTTGWGITCAIGAKGQPVHFEININSGDGSTAELGFYNDGSYGAVIGNVNAGEWYHITAVADSSKTAIYLNGTKIFEDHGYNMSALTDGDSCLTFGSLQDLSLMFTGLIDEAFLANYAMSDDEIAAVNGEPEAVRTLISEKVTSLYPEGYVKPTATPVPTATPAPTEAPQTDVPETNATAQPVITKAPEAAKKDDGKSVNPIIFIIIAAVAVIAVIAVIILKKKKK